MKKFLIIILLSLKLFAQDGTLDYTFDTDGRVTTDFGLTNEYIHSIALQTDGKIVAGGKTYTGTNYDFALARYNSDGNLDFTFGSMAGRVTTAVQSNDDILSAIKILNDGRILAAGTTYTGTWIQDFCVVKYNSNGTLDNTFGTGGKVILDIGNVSETATSIDVQSDGKILVAGYSSNSLNYDFALIRLNSDGTVDYTFGTSGIVKTAIGSENDQAFSVKVQSDGRILVGGRYHNGSNMDFVIVRYLSDGTIDNTFGTSGIVTANFDNRWDSGYSIAIQSDGKILLAGTAEVTASNMDFACIRINSDGSFDNTFGSSGKVNVNVYDINDYCYTVLLQNDNKILLGGATSSSFALARLNSNGSIDNSFDSDGRVITLFASTHTEPNSMVLQSDGKIIVGGNANVFSYTYTYDFALARYENPSALPVELTTFYASLENSNVKLVWQTATEVNNYGFEIERASTSSGNNISSFDWEKIGFVQGHGNSNSTKDYTFTDNNPPSGKTKYRLKQIDFDGSFSYSNEVEVNIEAPKKFALYQNYPNPFNPETTLKFSIPEYSGNGIMTTLTVYDVMGKQVATLVNEPKSPGTYEVKFNATQLSSGVYFYKLECGDFVQIKKFVLMK